MAYTLENYLDDMLEFDSCEVKSQEGKKLKFKMVTKYPHNRSEGMTRRTNGGAYLQPKR